jgi:hypothetical protein
MTFVRKAGRVIEAIEAENIHSALKKVKEDNKFPCFLITTINVNFHDGSQTTKQCSWFVNEVGELKPVSKGRF